MQVKCRNKAYFYYLAMQTVALLYTCRSGDQVQESSQVNYRLITCHEMLNTYEYIVYLVWITRCKHLSSKFKIIVSFHDQISFVSYKMFLKDIMCKFDVCGSGVIVQYCWKSLYNTLEVIV